MEKDRLESIIKSKLGEARIEPPADMWGRIEKSLGQAEGISANEPEVQYDQPAYDMPEAAPVITLRRPRKARMGFAAAASLMLIMSMIGLRYALRTPVGQDAPVFSQKTFVAPENIDRTIEDMVQGEIPLFNNRIDAGVSPVAKSLRHMIRERIFEGLPTEQSADIFQTYYSFNADGVAYRDHRQLANLSRSDIGRAMAVASASAAADVMPDNAADTDEPVVIIDWEKFDAAQAASSKRNRAPLSLSLYGSDFGSGQQTTDIYRPLNAVAESALEINEVHLSSAPALIRNEYIHQKLKHRIPVSVGFNFNIGLKNRLSLETGLIYTYLYSENDSSTQWDYSIDQKLHYLGIPLYVRYDFVDRPIFNIYGSAGGMLEKCVSGMVTRKVSGGGLSGTTESERMNVKGVQPSVGAQVGLEIGIFRSVGVYVEPGVSYYFTNDNQPKNYRTEHPFSFSLKAGVRIKL